MEWVKWSLNWWYVLYLQIKLINCSLLKATLNVVWGVVAGKTFLYDDGKLRLFFYDKRKTKHKKYIHERKLGNPTFNRSFFSQSYKVMLWKILFSFVLWLICENYLPLPPLQNDWPPEPKGPPLGGTPISTTVHKTKSTFSHSDFNSFHIHGGNWGIMKRGIG